MGLALAKLVLFERRGTVEPPLEGGLIDLVQKTEDVLVREVAQVLECDSVRIAHA